MRSPPVAISVAAPCRLHFGFTAFGPSHGRQFGGLGVMLDTPRVELWIEPARQFAVVGPHAERIEQLVERWRRWRKVDALAGLSVRLERAPALHVGLGVGTQLALAVAEGLDRLFGFPPAELAALARAMGRARRSAVGTHGFRTGGLVVDGGKSVGQSMGTLRERIGLPGSWRFVLWRPAGSVGLAGQREQQAFARLPEVPPPVAQRLNRLLQRELLPAARGGQIERMGEALYEYGRVAGSCFAAWQHGPYASPLLEEWVRQVRSMGIRGVGQSSWGPTLFALVPDSERAAELSRRLARLLGQRDVQIAIGEVSARGAVVRPSGIVHSA